VAAPTDAVVEPPMLAVPLAEPLPETETDVVTVAVEVLAVLDALADPAIALPVLNTKDNKRQGNTNCFEILIEEPFSSRWRSVTSSALRRRTACVTRDSYAFTKTSASWNSAFTISFLFNTKLKSHRKTLWNCLCPEFVS
jgi:hypothetical protein